MPSDGATAAVDTISASRLPGLVPALRRRVVDLMAALHAQGHPVRLTQGRRTLADQQALWNQGRTTRGHIVTFCDGVRNVSKHQTGRAADFVWMTEDGISWQGPWGLLMETAESLGLRAGGRWPKGRTDRPHVELPDAIGDDEE
jgi:peptidoglycan L-alanyl-D-glutamate endopeptidase CwlK